MAKTASTVALTIAGSDSGGGAGIQADLKTFASLKVHGTSAITCITAQNPDGVRAVQAIKPAVLQAQLAAIEEAFHPKGIKTGMLYSSAHIRTVEEFYEGRGRILVIDPVMVATSGALLLKTEAIRALKKLFALAEIITPNLPEASALLGRELRSVDDARSAAKELFSQCGAAVLVKGGHLKGQTQAIDFYYDGKEELLLEAPFLSGVKTHGTGCTYSAAIAGYRALGHSLSKSVLLGKEYITQAIVQASTVEGYTVLNSFWR